MAKLRANRRNYRKAFTTHANAYDNWNVGSDNSRRLLLCYCVECGLKCLIMINDSIFGILFVLKLSPNNMMQIMDIFYQF